MIEIKLYNYNGHFNTINKILENETIINGIVRNDFYNISPSLDIETTISTNKDLFSFNYLYVAEVKKYYFITDIMVIDTNMYRLFLKEDVLKTYEDKIKNILGTVISSEDEYKYNSDFNTLHNVKPSILKYSFENNFNENGNIIMVALRGKGAE